MRGGQLFSKREFMVGSVHHQMHSDLYIERSPFKNCARFLATCPAPSDEESKSLERVPTMHWWMNPQQFESGANHFPGTPITQQTDSMDAPPKEGMLKIPDAQLLHVEHVLFSSCEIRLRNVPLSFLALTPRNAYNIASNSVSRELPLSLHRSPLGHHVGFHLGVSPKMWHACSGNTSHAGGLQIHGEVRLLPDIARQSRCKHTMCGV